MVLPTLAYKSPPRQQSTLCQAFDDTAKLDNRILGGIMYRR